MSNQKIQMNEKEGFPGAHRKHPCFLDLCHPILLKSAQPTWCLTSNHILFHCNKWFYASREDSAARESCLPIH
jgi:hypothetical protein